MAHKTESITNLKEIREFGNIEFLAKQLVEGFITGLHRSPFHGFSVEFAEHRLYNTGESTRYIDWRIFAKTEKLFVKRYEEETNLRAHLLIDVSSSMYYPLEDYGKLTFSVMAAAAISYLLQKQKDAISLTSFHDKIDIQTPIKSTTAHTHKIFLLLENMLKQKPPTQKTEVAEVLHQIAEKINRRSLVIIFSDMFDDGQQQDAIFNALQHLKHNRHEVLLFHTVDHKQEILFDFPERPTWFIDVETGQKVKLMPGQIKKNYQTQTKEIMQTLKLRCNQYKIDYIEADIRKGFSQILYAYFMKRGKMV
jgi:uncharacterized protein (DUF58 family)